MSLIFVLRPKV